MNILQAMNVIHKLETCSNIELVDDVETLIIYKWNKNYICTVNEMMPEISDDEVWIDFTADQAKLIDILTKQDWTIKRISK